MIYEIKEPNPASGCKSKHDETVSTHTKWSEVVDELKKLNIKRNGGYAYVRFNSGFEA